jgi:hypothetical protein
MDPEKTWTMLLDAFQANDWSLVEETAEALLAWLAKGGFPPRLGHEDEQRSRLVVQMFCSQALASIPQSELRSPS